MKKINSVILSLLLTAALCVSVVCPAFAASNDKIGRYDFNITNPYATVDWDTWKAYKGATHVHTVRSDGNIELDDMIEKYYASGYQALALTDHGTVNYSWTKDQKRLTIFGYQFAVHGNVDELTEARYQQITTGSDRGGDGMTEIPLGIELNGSSSAKCHVNSYFADCGHGDLAISSTWPEDAIKKSQNAGGICHINHVGEWTEGKSDINTYNSDFVTKYANLFLNYSACIGMELVNTTDNRTHNDRYLYDETLKVTAPLGRNVWGFCEDDSHDYEDVENNAQYFVMPENNAANIRTSMENGTFFACSKNAKTDYELGNGFAAEGAFPMISRVTVDNDADQISINPYNAQTVKMIADGQVIAEKTVSEDNETITFDLNEYEDQINSYVRIYVLGAGGICYAQPFLVTKTEYKTSTVQFNIPYADATLRFMDSEGNVLEPINSENYYLVTAGSYSYTVEKDGYQTKSEKLTITQATVNAGLQIKVDVTLTKNPGPLTVSETTELIHGFDILQSITEPVNESVGIKLGMHFEYKDPTKPKTGDTVKIVDDATGNVVKTYTVVVFGDVNGDGIYDGRDATMVSMIIGGMITPDAAVKLAADCNHDGVINSDDLMLLEEAGVMLSSVAQKDEIKTSSIFAEYSSLISQDVETDEPAAEEEEKTEEVSGEENTEQPVKPTFSLKKLFETIVSFFGYMFGILD